MQLKNFADQTVFICDNCREKISRHASIVCSPSQHFCSTDCAYRWTKGGSHAQVFFLLQAPGPHRPDSELRQGMALFN